MNRNIIKGHESKIDFDELVNDFRVTETDLFISYLTEIWIDLHLRSDNLTLGISKTTFFQVDIF